MLQKICELLQFGYLSISEAAAKGEDSLMAFWREFVAKALNLVPSDQPYKTALFDALNKKVPSFAFEGVLLRENPQTGELEVYLTQRSLDDTAYPGEFHAPGSALRNGEDWHAVAVRLARSEYKVPVRSVVMLYEAMRFYPEKRGWYCSIPCQIELEGEPAVGKWYPVNALPEKTVHSHRDFIIPVVVRYWKNRQLCDASKNRMRQGLGL